MGSADTSGTVVDLSDENDTTTAQPGTAPARPPNTDSPFERSCDNPECSAPKLISLVPKRETPEFITEPLIMNQPTLINGFTTVFQVDGVAAKMNDIMNGNQEASPNVSKPQSVFRIVPNTHAHIVNYVVVDGAGETMRKIKANDAETMRKLLDSQRLSAEQMLKKLIGKAFKTSSMLNGPIVPLPIPSKIPGFTNLQPPTTNGGPLPAVLSTVPPGITITPLPAQNKQAVNVSMPNVSQTTTNTTTPSAPLEVIRPVVLPAPIVVPPKTAVSPPRPSIPTAVQAVASENITPTKDAEVPRKTIPNILKRKSAFISESETKKRLRTRSPKQKTPMAAGFKTTIGTIIPPAKKLPTLLPKPAAKSIQHAEPLPQPTPLVSKKSPPDAVVPHKFVEEVPITIESHPMATTENANVKEVISNDNITPPRTKPLMGPASKMKALRASKIIKIVVPPSAPKTEASDKNLPSQIALKKAETKSTNNSDTIPRTKPCSVAIVKADISSTLAAKYQKDPNYESKLVSVKPKRMPLDATTRSPGFGIAETEVEKDPLSIDDASSLSPSHSDEAITPDQDKISNEISPDKKTEAITMKKDANKPETNLAGPLTRSSTPKMSKTPSKPDDSPKSPAVSSRVTEYSKELKSMKLPLPVLKSGVMTIPIRSPHPNLKISSVVSGGSALAALAADGDVSLPKKRLKDSSAPDIEKLQQELADLRRTVARLSKKKS